MNVPVGSGSRHSTAADRWPWRSQDRTERLLNCVLLRHDLVTLYILEECHFEILTFVLVVTSVIAWMGKNDHKTDRPVSRWHFFP
jgi:hypothetical protein